MRAALGVLVCAALVSAVPNLLPGDPRLAEGSDHHHGDHHGDHGDLGDHGDHHGDHGDHGDHATDASAPEGTVDYGAGIQVTPRKDDQEGHFNPFLPSYQPVADPRRPASRQPDGQTPNELSQEASNFNQRLTSQPNQQALRPFTPIRPEDLNLNPGVGESGQKDVVRRECGSGLICVPEERCDRYTGFVKGVLQRTEDPSLPTVAIQRCQLEGSTGFCCQQKPRPVPQFENEGQQPQTYPNQAQSPAFQPANQQTSTQFSNQQSPQVFLSQQQPQQFFNTQQPQQISNERPPQQFSNQQRPLQQYEDQQSSKQLGNRPLQQFSSQQQASQQFSTQLQPPQQFGNQQQPLQRPVNPLPSRPFDPIRPEDLNLNPGVGESGQKDVVRQECGSGLICVPEEQCDRYTGFVKGALDSATDPSLPTIAIQRCQLDDSTGFCCQQKPKPLPQFANQGQQPQAYPNQAQPPVFPPTNQQASQQFSNQRPPQQFSSQQPSQQFFNQRPPQQFSNQQTSQPFSNQRPVQQFSNQQPVQQFSNQRPSQQFSNQQQQPQKFSSQQRPPQQYEDQQPSAVQEGNRQRPTQQFPNQQRPPQQSENQQSSRPFESIRPEDLNLNPGVGESGQKDVVRRACGAGLICVPEERCDRYTGFVKGALQRTLDPALPTVAIQRCQLEDTTGFCCQPTPGRPNGGRPVSGGRRPLQGNERVPQSGGQSFPSLPNTPVRRPLGPQPARFSNNPFLNSATSGVSRPQDRVSAGLGPRPRPSSAPTAPQRGVTGRPQSGEEIRCGDGLECVQVNRCGADGYITDRAGLGASSPGLRTFCMTAYRKRGVCCRTRPVSAPQSGSLSKSRPVSQKSQRLQVKPNSPLQKAQGPSKSQPQQQQPENPNQQPDVAKLQSGLSSSGLLPPPPSETFGPGARAQPSSPSEADPEIPRSSETDQETLSSPGADPKISPPSEEESVAPSEDTGVPFGCGLSRPIEAPGIQTAEGEAEFGELPWQAIILYTNYTFVCGGALVSDLHVVLSAHCVQYLEASDIVVRLGEYQINSEKEPYPHQDIAVDIIYMHPGFRQGPLFRDIAVLKLSSPVKPSPHISAICLPRENQSFAGRRGIASGWGLAAFDAGIAASLQKVDVPILENGVCEAQLKKTSLGSFFRLDSSFTCAGGEADVNACQDGGGPLSCRVDGRYFLAGVASWSIGCGVKDVPAVFASAPSTMDFIEVAMGLASPDTSANSIKRATDRDEGFPYGR